MYDAEGADELTFLDISASHEGRATTMEIVSRTAEQVFIPLTVGGGVGSVEDVDRLLRAGADKVAVNTAAIRRPELVAEIADRFGNQVLVLSVDARRAAGHRLGLRGDHPRRSARRPGWTRSPGRREAAELGAGEILLNAMDADGTKDGFDLELIRLVRAAVSIPVIASGGAGAVEHFPPAVDAGADAVLAATVFHFGTLRIARGQAGPGRGRPPRPLTRTARVGELLRTRGPSSSRSAGPASHCARVGHSKLQVYFSAPSARSGLDVLARGVAAGAGAPCRGSARRAGRSTVATARQVCCVRADHPHEASASRGGGAAGAVPVERAGAVEHALEPGAAGSTSWSCRAQRRPGRSGTSGAASACSSEGLNQTTSKRLSRWVVRSPPT